MSEALQPKVFLSYSWSSPDHERWVMDLATALVESNVEVVFDKWDLKEGHDSIRFMEKIVNDHSVSKVLIISDKTYAAKADGRQGGVGTETQIISAEMYASIAEQDKFAVIVSERDEQGKAHLPTYYKGRIYIDLSDENGYAAEFERLLRWLYNKPLNVRPPQGKTPDFLLEGDHPTIGTSLQFKRTLDALINGKPTALGSFTEYLRIFSENLDRFHLTEEKDIYIDDQVIKSIAELLPAKNEFLSVLSSVATYAQNDDYGNKLHSFFEALHQHLLPPRNVAYQESIFDNFRFLFHELFLSAFAIFIKRGRVDLCLSMLVDYYLPESAYTRHEPMVSYGAFVSNLSSLEQRKRRTSSRQVSLHADLLIERLPNSGLRKNDFIQADVVLYLRAFASNGHWRPITHIYVDAYGPLEIFARAKSVEYFKKIAPLLGVETPEQFQELVKKLEAAGRTLGHGFHEVSFSSVTAVKEIASR